MSTTPKMPLLALGAHPDDIEFGCGGIIAREANLGRQIHFAVCSQGESGSRGTPTERTAEAEKAAAIFGASIEFIELDGDAYLENRIGHCIRLAGLIRKVRPSTVLAPSLVENQHPDHAKLGQLMRDAARLARYGGLKELQDLPSHAIEQLFYYAVNPQAEPIDITPVIIDISSPGVVAKWTEAMIAHTSQLSRSYIELQLARAQVLGLQAGVSHAMALFPNDPIIFDSLSEVGRTMRHF